MTDHDSGDRHGHPRPLDRIVTTALPDVALLCRYREAGAYTDCYAIDVAGPVSQADYVEAFYTTWVFKLERRLLAWFVSKPSTDPQARALADGQTQAFAAWHVEDRTGNQLLMCDFQSRTRSWLMSVSLPFDATTVTRLHFGSAVVPATDPRSGRKAMGFVFRALLGFHKVYSRILLRAAVSRLRRVRAAGA